MYGQHQKHFGPISCIFWTCKNTITNPKQAEQDPKVVWGSTRQILNKPKGRKKGSRQYKKAVKEEGEERKQASKQAIKAVLLY